MAECVRGKGCRIRTPACRIGKFKEIVKSKANALDFLQFLSIFYRVICVRINPFFGKNHPFFTTCYNKTTSCYTSRFSGKKYVIVRASKIIEICQIK